MQLGLTVGCQCDRQAGYDVYLAGRADPIRVAADAAAFETRSLDDTMLVFRSQTAVVSEFDLKCLAGYVKVDR
jgi:hypothetical protein